MPDRRALVAGFFSTVGDIECLHVVERWLLQLNIAYDIAPYAKSIRKAMPGSYDFSTIDASAYTHLIIVCGPCWQDFFTGKLALTRFRHCVRIGVNLTMIDKLEAWNPFDVLLERDSNHAHKPDLSFLEPTTELPVVGRCIMLAQNEYAHRQRHHLANQLIQELLSRRNCAVLEIDTRWQHPENTTGFKTPAAVLSVLKRVDLLLTTRLHGLVFALKAGVPVIALDAIAGGDKVSAQAKVIGWPLCIPAEDVTIEWMDQAMNWCYSEAAKQKILDCRQHLLPMVTAVEDAFRTALLTSITPSPLPLVRHQKPNWLQRLHLRKS